MKLKVLKSRKHPGATFLKVAGSKADFVCKIYPEHEHEAERIAAAIESTLHSPKLGPLAELI